MRVRRIAGFLLVVYLAICASFIFHTHLTERAGDHCALCQILHAPGYGQQATTHAPSLIVQETCLSAVPISAGSEYVSTSSERAPPIA